MFRCECVECYLVTLQIHKVMHEVGPREGPRRSPTAPGGHPTISAPARRKRSHLYPECRMKVSGTLSLAPVGCDPHLEPVALVTKLASTMTGWLKPRFDTVTGPD
ncbi:hypothetical protein CBL_12157 [Carabus blaptoides fortunei]